MTSAEPPAVTLQRSSPRGMAAVSGRLAVRRIPALFRTYLDQVYAAARTGVIQVDGQNIFVYRTIGGPDDEVDAEFGVGVGAPFAPVGNVHYSQLPDGEVATATHWGDYARLDEAHAAVIEWCRTNDRERTGTRWEVYGHWVDDPARLRTDVFYLLK